MMKRMNLRLAKVVETPDEYYDKDKDVNDFNRKRREGRAFNGNIECECGLLVKPENGKNIKIGYGTGKVWTTKS